MFGSWILLRKKEGKGKQDGKLVSFTLWMSLLLHHVFLSPLVSLTKFINQKKPKANLIHGFSGEKERKESKKEISFLELSRVLFHA